MASRVSLLLALALAARTAAALTLTTLSVPGVQPTDAPYFIWSAIGTGTDGHTTYAVRGTQPSGASNSDHEPFTATVALGASDAVVYESEPSMGAVTESCAWGADAVATCVIVGPRVSGSATVTGTETFTDTVGAIAVTLAADPPGSSAPSSAAGSDAPSTSIAPAGSASASGTPSTSGGSSSGAAAGSPGASAGSSGAAAPSATTSGGGKMAASSAAILTLSILAVSWTL